MKTFVLDSSSQFATPLPPKFSADKNSIYFKQNLEVYNQSKNLSPEQQEIARYWDDSPFVLERSGHLMFANKKITPGGHWIGITAIACKKTHADAVKTAQAYALTSVAMFDAFTSCWQDKYKSSYIPPGYCDQRKDRPFLDTAPANAAFSRISKRAQHHYPLSNRNADQAVR